MLRIPDIDARPHIAASAAVDAAHDDVFGPCMHSSADDGLAELDFVLVVAWCHEVDRIRSGADRAENGGWVVHVALNDLDGRVFFTQSSGGSWLAVGSVDGCVAA